MNPDCFYVLCSLIVRFLGHLQGRLVAKPRPPQKNSYRVRVSVKEKCQRIEQNVELIQLKHGGVH